MKDAEIIETMRTASAILKRYYTSGVDVPASSQTTDELDAIADALEANPPLAEVETEIIVGILDINVSVEDGPVTVTIRGRGDVPEPPAISSSIR